jgi:uncharacterized membrane protein
MRLPMKKHRLLVCIIICVLLLFLLPLHQANCQNYYEYNVQVESDGSAIWTITQFSSANAPVDTWEGFQNRIFDLVDNASSVTHREMAVDESSVQINSNISSESKVTEYLFVWQNFSTVQDNELILGDVFQITDFFSRLYGDAALQLSYPLNFSIKSIYPPPYERQDAEHTLRWSRTQDLVNNNVKVVLASIQQTTGNGSNSWQQYVLVIVILVVAVVLSLLGFYTIRRRRVNDKTTSPILEGVYSVESGEDKVLKLLKSAGGSMRQSEITDQCRFSKAKTSQLLSALEARGVITRYKKGRDKIVIFKEREKGEKL